MRGPAVLVIHSWWGLTSSFVDFGEALAEKVFVVGLADLFEGRTDSDPAEAQRLRSSS
jgi:carboxymethylenebutenolidase